MLDHGIKFDKHGAASLSILRLQDYAERVVGVGAVAIFTRGAAVDLPVFSRVIVGGRAEDLRPGDGGGAETRIIGKDPGPAPLHLVWTLSPKRCGKTQTSL